LGEGTGKPLADQYQAQRLDMVDTHAQFEDGSLSVEAGLADMLIRMESGASRFSSTYRLVRRIPPLPP
jgi:hypothetical protein